MPAPPQPGEPGWLLGGRYRVVDRIGAGGMAEVFRAHDQLLARDVAVKVFRAHTDPDEVTGGVQRQELELQTLARLSHPNLITLFDGSIGSDGEPAFLVMELINGPSLAARIAQSPLSEPETREIATQIAGALAYVHSQHMVHRDIKPANILLGADGTTGETTVRARLSDFGIVRLLGSEHLTSADFMIGTASYLAPEQARGAEVGPPADVYALGLVLIEALTGRRSYEGPALEAVLARLDRSPEIPVGLPQPWPELLRAMTLTDPELRPSAVEVARALRESGPMATPVLPVPGSRTLAGEAVLAGGAPLAAAAGLAGTAALAEGTGFPAAPGFAAGSGFTAAPGSTAAPGYAAVPGFPAATGFTATPGFTAAPGGPDAAPMAAAAGPDQPTAFISAGLPPMPPPADDGSAEPAEPQRRRAGAVGRGSLAGAVAAAAVLVTALTAGGLLLVRDPAPKQPSSVLPGQSVSSSARPAAGATPSSTPTSLAPIGAVPSVGTGVTTARTSSGAASSTPASSSAAPTTSVPPSSSSAAPTTSAPPSSSSAPTSSPSTSSASSSPTSGTSTSPASSGAGTGTSSGPGTTSAAPAGASTPPPSASKAKPNRSG